MRNINLWWAVYGAAKRADAAPPALTVAGESSACGEAPAENLSLDAEWPEVVGYVVKSVTGERY
jgi:hypothetical protein